MLICEVVINRGQRDKDYVKSVYKSNNVVELGWLHSVLQDSGFDAVILDTHTSILEGSIGAIPRRLMVPDDDEMAARRLIDLALRSIARESK